MNGMGMHSTLLRACLVVVVVFPLVDLPVFSLFCFRLPSPKWASPLEFFVGGECVGRHVICFVVTGTQSLLWSDVERLDAWCLYAVRTRGRLWNVGDPIDTMTMEVHGTKTTLGRL
jgi:hypothetical protein